MDPKTFEVRVFQLYKDPDTPTRLLRFGDVLTPDLLPGFGFVGGAFAGASSAHALNEYATAARRL